MTQNTITNAMSEGGRLSSHVLDTALGRPAAGLRLRLSRFDAAGNWRLLADEITTADGRTRAPLLQGEDLRLGQYELVFHAGDYLRAQGIAQTEPLFLDLIPIRFGVADATAHYHIPLLLSPFGYSTYRGS